LNVVEDETVFRQWKEGRSFFIEEDFAPFDPSEIDLLPVFQEKEMPL